MVMPSAKTELEIKNIFQTADGGQDIENGKEFETWLIRMGLSPKSGLGVSRSGIYADFN